MKLKPAFGTFSFLAILLLIALPGPNPAHDHAPVKNMNPTRVIFDFRDGVPESALVHLQLVHQTYMDTAAGTKTARPEFVVVFMDSSVKLLSKNRGKFSPEQKKMLKKLDKTISAMTKDGVNLEVCVFAADFYGVDPQSFSPVIKRVENGWISSMHYQAKGYSMVPAF